MSFRPNEVPMSFRPNEVLMSFQPNDVPMSFRPNEVSGEIYSSFLRKRNQTVLFRSICQTQIICFYSSVYLARLVSVSKTSTAKSVAFDLSSVGLSSGISSQIRLKMYMAILSALGFCLNSSILFKFV